MMEPWDGPRPRFAFTDGRQIGATLGPQTACGRARYISSPRTIAS